MAAQKVPSKIAALLVDLDLPSTATRAGWCIQEGLSHIYTADQGKLAPLIDRHGLPAFYSCLSTGKKNPCRHKATQDLKDPANCFESLCRTIAGQFVSGFAAQAAWKRLLATTEQNLTPTRILLIVSKSSSSVDDDSYHVDESLVEQNLQKPVGITRAKARSIVDLARHFHEGKLSEELLTETRDEATLRKALLSVKGLGPWSCDMFLIFYLERPDILPLGDLGVRKGIALHFGLRGCLKGGQLCPRKDAERVEKSLEHYQPFSSLLAYYMWRAVDTPLMEGDNITSGSKKKKVAASVPMTVPSTPRKKRERSPAKKEEAVTTTPRRRSVRRRVTP